MRVYVVIGDDGQIRGLFHSNKDAEYCALRDEVSCDVEDWFVE